MEDTFSLSGVKVAMTPMARFEEFLRSRGKRITQQRRTILEQVFSHHEHFDAENLLAELAHEGKANGPGVVHPAQVPDEHQVPQRLRHLGALVGNHPDMHPVPGEWLTVGRFALGGLALVVREGQVVTAAVEVDGLAEGV